jgi:hypothetical protein
MKSKDEQKPHVDALTRDCFRVGPELLRSIPMRFAAAAYVSSRAAPQHSSTGFLYSKKGVLGMKEKTPEKVDEERERLLDQLIDRLATDELLQSRQYKLLDAIVTEFVKDALADKKKT